jgi:acyl-ACP thioesterase
VRYDIVYTKKIKNSFSNIGASGELKIVNIMNMLQDIAVEYAMKLKISSRELATQNLFWVISRYQIEINRFAQLNDNLLISIQRNTHKSLYDLRWFKIETEDHQEIVNALGAWVMIDKKTGTPKHLDQFMTAEMLNKNTENVKKFFNNLSMIDKTHHEQSFKIRTHDLDLNQHVNNSTYVEWAVEALPEQLLKNFTIKKIKVVYLKESFYPGQITSKTQINHSEDTFDTLHTILENNSNNELARININWQPL